MDTMKARLTGDAPLIMQADTLADPLHPLTKKYKSFSSKDKKTDATQHALGQIEFEAGLYIDANGPYVPSDYIMKTTVEAARMNKDGKKIERGVFILEDRFSLRFDGPRTLAELLSTPAFHYRKTVVVGQSRVARVRPIFREWSLDIQLVFDSSIVNLAAIREALDRAGKYIGIGNRRPNKGGNFGRFSVEAL